MSDIRRSLLRIFGLGFGLAVKLHELGIERAAFAREFRILGERLLLRVGHGLRECGQEPPAK